MSISTNVADNSDSFPRRQFIASNIILFSWCVFCGLHSALTFFLLGELRDAVKSGDYMAVKLALNSKEDYNLDQEVRPVPLPRFMKAVLFKHFEFLRAFWWFNVLNFYTLQCSLSLQYDDKSTFYKYKTDLTALHLGCPQHEPYEDKIKRACGRRNMGCLNVKGQGLTPERH